MQDYATADHESIDERTRRAATEAMVVVNEAACLFTVYSGETGEYRVDLRFGTCECADARYRERECKHQKRVLMAIGEDEIPEGVDVDPVLRNRREDAGDATDTDADTDTSERAIATDGGAVARTPESDVSNASEPPGKYGVPTATIRRAHRHVDNPIARLDLREKLVESPLTERHLGQPDRVPDDPVGRYRDTETGRGVDVGESRHGWLVTRDHETHEADVIEPGRVRPAIKNGRLVPVDTQEGEDE